MTDPLFAALPSRRGPVRRSLDDRVAEVRADGRTLDADLVLVVQSLADRIDDANALDPQWLAAMGWQDATSTTSTSPPPFPVHPFDPAERRRREP